MSQESVFATGKRKVGFCLANINRQWPSVKYCSLGFYSAWILLVMGGSSLLVPPVGLLDGNANNLLYLYSGIPLTLILILCGAFNKKVEPYIFKGPLVPCMAVLASVCTFIAMGGLGFPLGRWEFLLACAGTGIGTPFICLRIGIMYSTMDTHRIFFMTLSSALLANLLYFMCVAIDRRAALVLLSLFPLFAVILALLKKPGGERRDEFDVIPTSMLPKGFFARCVLFISVFTIAIGAVKGMATMTIDPTELRQQGTTMIFASFLVTVSLMLVATILNGVRRFDFSQFYYPIIVVTTMACLISPLLGSQYLWLQTIIMNTAYNIFVLGMWCLFSNISGQTDASPTRVFGFGRGASAFGTTFGQFLSFVLVGAIPGIQNFLAPIGACTAVIMLAFAMLIFDERTIKEALDKTFRESVEPARGGVEPSQSGLWEDACVDIARRCGLTSRESEVLGLLGKGRTATYIAEELGISYNTTKGHIRNLYAKCGVHSRQEIIDLIDGGRAN